jgi:hypothetical protein
MVWAIFWADFFTNPSGHNHPFLSNGTLCFLPSRKNTEIPSTYLRHVFKLALEILKELLFLSSPNFQATFSTVKVMFILTKDRRFFTNSSGHPSRKTQNLSACEMLKCRTVLSSRVEAAKCRG